MDPSYDDRLRGAAIDYVLAIAEASGGMITRQELELFRFEGEQVKLSDPARGIRNPKQLPATLTIMTNPKGPYPDHLEADGLFRYKTRTGDWAIGDNRKLHEAFERGVPIIWLQKLRDAVFVPLAPVFLVGAEPNRHQYALAIGEDLRWATKGGDTSAIERRWVETMTLRRLHQPLFRARVISAYERQCAVCGLRHVELLDAAHITPDKDTAGDAVVTNGLALCKIHHGAYDKDILGIRPDLTVHVATTVLEESDGPMLRYGLQGFHDRHLLVVPRLAKERPDTDRLQGRYQAFLEAAG
jgi:putative restriction endonuclease